MAGKMGSIKNFFRTETQLDSDAANVMMGEEDGKAPAVEGPAVEGASRLAADVFSENETVVDEVPTAASASSAQAGEAQAQAIIPEEVLVDESLNSSLSFMFEEVGPLCAKCGSEVDPFRAQIKKKARPSLTWICNVCNSRMASLCRHFGRWPVAEFQELSKEEQDAFYRDIRLDDMNLKQIESTLLDRVTKKRSDSVEASVSGEWLPLSVWQSRGFNVDDIQRNASGVNIKRHPMLGTVYRVPIASLSRRTIETREREAILDRWIKMNDVARKAMKCRPAPSAAEDAEPAEVVADALLLKRCIQPLRLNNE